MYGFNYEVKKADTLYSISRHFNVGISDLMDANPLVNLYHITIGESILIPVCVPKSEYTHFTTYLVREEDTLDKILKENSLHMADLLEFNDMEDIYLLPGTTLKVPITGEGEGGILL